MGLNSNRLVGIQYLRALAALMVAYSHLSHQIPGYLSTLSLHRWVTTDRLYNGVSIFFVISGFIMYVTGVESSPAQFAKRRIVRIVPLYWLLTGLLFLCALLTPEFARATVATAQTLAKSLLFIPYFNSGQDGKLVPMLVPGWTLNCEMFFYLIFTLTLFAPLRWRMPLSTSILGALVVLGLLSPHSRELSYYGFYTSVMLSQFAIGIVIGSLYKSGRINLPAGVSLGLLVAGLGLLFCPADGSAKLNALDTAGSSLLVLGTVGLKDLWPYWRVPNLLGDASYSMYLSHLFTVSAIRILWIHFHLEGAILFGLVCTAGICVVSIVLYKMVEYPILKLLSGRKHDRREHAPAPAQHPLHPPARQPVV